MLRDIWLVICGDLSEEKFRLLSKERDWYQEQAKVAASMAEQALNQRDSFVTTLLAIDEELSRIQQCTSWSQMQPIWARLWQGAEARRAHVSGRIGQQQVERLESTFKPEDYEISEEETDRMIREAEATRSHAMSILLPRVACDRALTAINNLFKIAVYPRLSWGDASKVRTHFEYLRTARQELETTVKVESSEVVGRTVITIVLDLKESANGPRADG